MKLQLVVGPFPSFFAAMDLLILLLVSVARACWLWPAAPLAAKIRSFVGRAQDLLRRAASRFSALAPPTPTEGKLHVDPFEYGVRAGPGRRLVVLIGESPGRGLSSSGA